jgi:hypothetical protein
MIFRRYQTRKLCELLEWFQAFDYMGPDAFMYLEHLGSLKSPNVKRHQIKASFIRLIGVPFLFTLCFINK